MEHWMYSERLLEHFQNPRNVGELAPPALTVEVENPACGDILRLSVRFEGEQAAEVRYKVRGCTASIAAGSALTEWIAGKSREQLAHFRPAAIEAAIGGLPPESKHAAVLCADGLRALLRRAANPSQTGGSGTL
jgi:nitrogen fixation protein NifU and related proteins